jgi:hypothetical protein
MKVEIVYNDKQNSFHQKIKVQEVQHLELL